MHDDSSMPTNAVDLLRAALGIADSLAEDLYRESEPRVIRAGGTLFRAGQPADDMFVVMSGELIATVETPTGTVAVTATSTAPPTGTAVTSPTAGLTPSPTGSVIASPTPTPPPLESPTPTATSPPTGTVTPSPTATASPTPTATPTPTALEGRV